MLRRRLLKDSASRLTTSLTDNKVTVEPNSGSLTFYIYWDGELLKDSGVSVTYSGKVSKATYSSNTGKVTVNYTSNTSTTSIAESQVIITYKNKVCYVEITHSVDYVVDTETVLPRNVKMSEVVVFNGVATQRSYKTLTAYFNGSQSCNASFYSYMRDYYKSGNYNYWYSEDTTETITFSNVRVNIELTDIPSNGGVPSSMQLTSLNVEGEDIFGGYYADISDSKSVTNDGNNYYVEGIYVRDDYYSLDIVVYANMAIQWSGDMSTSPITLTIYQIG